MRHSRINYAIAILVVFVVMLVILMGCGGGGGSSSTIVPNDSGVVKHPYAGTFDDGDGNSLVITNTGNVTMRTSDDYGKMFSLTGTVTENGYFDVTGKDSKNTTVTIRMWTSISRYGITTYSISINFAGDNKTYSPVGDIFFEKK